MKRIVILGLVLIATTRDASFAAPAADAPAREVSFQQRLGATVPDDIALRDESGRTVSLRDYFVGQPVILVLGYYHCPNLCSTVMTALVESLGRVTRDAGPAFQLVAVSIDPREDSPVAASTKAAYLRAYDRPGAASSWHFLTGEEAQIRHLAASIGFSYRYDRALGQYAHPAGIVLLTPGERIARYFLGVSFPAPELDRALVDASAERTGALSDRILLLCFHYDPRTGAYTPAILELLRFACGTAVLGLAALALRAFVRERRASRAREATRKRPAP